MLKRTMLTCLLLHSGAVLASAQSASQSDWERHLTSQQLADWRYSLELIKECDKAVDVFSRKDYKLAFDLCSVYFKRSAQLSEDLPHRPWIDEMIDAARIGHCGADAECLKRY
jgi:hypothetical protein